MEKYEVEIENHFAENEKKNQKKIESLQKENNFLKK